MPFVNEGSGVVRPGGVRSGPTADDTIQPHAIPVAHRTRADIRSLSDIRDDMVTFLRRRRLELMLAPLGSDPASRAAADAHNEIAGCALAALDERIAGLAGPAGTTPSRFTETEP